MSGPFVSLPIFSSTSLGTGQLREFESPFNGSRGELVVRDFRPSVDDGLHLRLEVVDHRSRCHLGSRNDAFLRDSSVDDLGHENRCTH